MPVIAEVVPYESISGLIAQVGIDLNLTVSPGSCVDDTNLSYIISPTTLLIDPSQVGVANGLDTGSFAQNEMYSVFLIWGTPCNPPAALISLSPTSPVLPTGYPLKRLIGYARTINNSATFLQTLVVGQGNFRKLSYSLSDFQNTYSGIFSVSNSSVYSLSLYPFLPPIISGGFINVVNFMGFIQVGALGGNGILFLNTSYSGVGNIFPDSTVQLNVPTGPLVTCFIPQFFIPIQASSGNPTLYIQPDSNLSIGDVGITLLGFDYMV